MALAPFPRLCGALPATGIAWRSWHFDQPHSMVLVAYGICLLQYCAAGQGSFPCCKQRLLPCGHSADDTPFASLAAWLCSHDLSLWFLAAFSRT